jgi:hypothetical protein
MRCRHALIPVSVVAMAAVSLVAAGCGGGGSSSTAATTSARTGPLAFARCMRAHGLSGWPDPGPGGKFDKSALVQLGYSATRVRTVEDSACGRLLAVGGGPQATTQQQRARLADELSFARCMRSHGVTQFPDPDAQGELSVEMVQAQGIDVRSPAVLRTVQECLPASHGALTEAKVRQALREAGAG